MDAKATLRDYLTKSADAVDVDWHDGKVSLATAIAKRNDEAVAKALNDPMLGAQLGRKRQAVAVPVPLVKAAIAPYLNTDESVTVPPLVNAEALLMLQWLVTGDEFPASLAGSVSAVLEPYPTAKAAFDALFDQSASIAVALLGRPVSVVDVSDALNPDPVKGAEAVELEGVTRAGS